MKAFSALLILIVGAAVVLWYGNTLNSWVAGGLIGGLGALLLSIPISLVFFSYFSRQYNEYQQEEALAHEEISLVRHASYSIVNEDEEYLDYEDQEFYSEYDDEDIYKGGLDGDEDGYLLAEQSVWEEQEPRRLLPPRHLASPSSAHFPAVNQDLSSQVQHDNYGADLERQPVQRRKKGSRSIKSSGYRIGPSYSHYRSQALHAARMEAVSRAEYHEEGVFPSTRTRGREQIQRSSQGFPLQEKDRKPRSSRDLAQSSADAYSRRPRRVVDALPPQDSSRWPLSRSGDASPTDRLTRGRDPQTEYDMDEPATNNLRRPLVRRAPYMYEDDPLREEMAQYVKQPIVRRSTRYLKPSSADDM